MVYVVSHLFVYARSPADPQSVFRWACL